MATPMLLVESLGGAKHGQKRQGPHTVGPCHRHQHHTTEPAQAADFDNMRVGRPHGVAI